MHRYPQYNVLHTKIWKSALTVFALVALITLAWELYEFFLDYFDMFVIHTNASYFDTLAQPSLIDTMGDATFELLGALVGLVLLRVFDARSLRYPDLHSTDKDTVKR